jgi:ABC-type ATPase with predicted acetyltransferase domain
MGHEAIYKCNKCSNELRSQEGGGFFFIEYRCIDCDTLKAVNAHRLVSVKDYREPAKEEIGVCEECGGELRDDLRPMCPKCKSRDVNETKVSVHYD